MENLFVTIPIEIAKDSDVYKAAEEFSKQNGDLEVFSSPEKVLEHCITFGMFPHISNSMSMLERAAAAYKAKANKGGK